MRKTTLEKNNSYILWKSMHNRCNNSEINRVCDYWYSYENFRKWYNRNYVEGWELDKDLLGNNLYSPNTCCFLPKWLNVFISVSKKPIINEKNGKYTIKCEFDGFTIKKSFNSLLEAEQGSTTARSIVLELAKRKAIDYNVDRKLVDAMDYINSKVK